ncbi:MAG: hypothetical protein ACO263_08020 [Cyclobacteriaceae bacterium]
MTNWQGGLRQAQPQLRQAQPQLRQAQPKISMYLYRPEPFDYLSF